MIAGIFESARGSRSNSADTVRKALAPEADAEVLGLGALTVGWTSPATSSSLGPVHAVVEGPADAAVLAAAYRSEGSDALHALRDEFALVTWDEDGENGLVARDPLGMCGLFFADAGGVLCFASEVRVLLRLLATRPGPDHTAVAHWIAYGSELADLTFYSGVRRLAPGSSLVLGRDWRTERYWRPAYREPPELGREEAAARLFSTIEASVLRHVDGARTGILLSGGFDSACVASVMKRAGKTPRAYSATFPEQPSVDESALIDSLLGTLGMSGVRVIVRPGNPLPAALDYLSRWELPLPSLGHFYTAPLLERAVSDGTGVVLDGEGGDEAFGFDDYVMADLLARGRIIKALSLAAGLAGGGPRARRRALAILAEWGLRGLLPYGVQQGVRQRRDPRRYAPRWMTERSARLLHDSADPWAWKRTSGPRWWAHRLHVLTDAADALGVGDYLRRRAHDAGVKMAHPLLSLDLVELALELPTDLALDGQDERALARASVKGVMPESARLRLDKSYFNALHNDCLAGEIELLRQLLLGRDVQIHAYVSPEEVKSVLLDRPPPPERRPMSGWAPPVWRLAAMETWLRAQEDPDYPEKAARTLSRPILEFAPQ